MSQPSSATDHSLIEDLQALLIGTLFCALSVLFFRHAGLMTGGSAGLAFLVHYASGWAFGPVFFLINLPFYLFGLRAMGREFTLKTFAAVILLSAYVELLPRLIVIEALDPVFAAVMGGLLAGVGLLMLIRHRASLGGIGVMALYLQSRRGWRAGTVQMIADALILGGSLLLVSPWLVALSVLGAAAVNLVIGVNHRPGRYFGI